MSQSASTKKICQVCGEAAKPMSQFYSHYGALCCLSCKAFFRRIFRELKSTQKLKCKHEGKCDISAKNKCRKCRFDKCIKVGMNPQLVPDEEESKKYTYPRKSNPEDLLASLSPNLSQTLNNIVAESILRNFHEAESEVSPSKAIIGLYIDNHLDLAWNEGHCRQLLDIYAHHMDLFQRFAQRSSYFLDLPQDDQRQLLKCNSGLFSSYIMTRYFGAETGLDQLTWLFGAQLPNLTLSLTEKLQHVGLREFFNTPWTSNKSITDWLKVCHLLRSNFWIPQSLNGLVAQFLLFSTCHWANDSPSSLIKLPFVSDICKMTESLLQAYFGAQQNLDNLVKILKIVDNNITCWISQASAARFHDLFNDSELNTYETSWIQLIGNIFHKSTGSETAIQNLATSYLTFKPNLAKDDPEMIQTMLTAGTICALERFEQCLYSLAEEMKLNIREVNMANFPKANALLMQKFFSIPSLKNQLKLMNIDLDLDGPPTTEDLVHSISPHANFYEWEVRRQIGKRLQNFLLDDECFVLAMVSVLVQNLCDYDDWMKFHEMVQKMLLKKMKQSKHAQPEARLYGFFFELNEFCDLSSFIVDHLASLEIKE